jgi:hypothetical protein
LLRRHSRTLGTTECYSPTLRRVSQPDDPQTRPRGRSRSWFRSSPGGQAVDTLAPRCVGRMRLASLTRSDQRRVGDLLRVLTSPARSAPTSSGSSTRGLTGRDGRSPDLPGGVGVGPAGHDRGAVSHLGTRSLSEWSAVSPMSDGHARLKLQAQDQSSDRLTFRNRRRRCRLRSHAGLCRPPRSC